MSYRAESTALDAEILRAIETWRAGEAFPDGAFEDLAGRIFAYQLRYNAPYARYAASRGVSSASLPADWAAIPAVPTAAFKETTLATFDPAGAVLAFETSGTTQGVGGRHYFDTTALYDAALLAGFERFMLAGAPPLRYLNLVPNPSERPESSLGYMLARVAASFGDGQTGWYLRGDDILIEAFARDLRTAIADGAPVCIAATAFALVNALDAFVSRGLAFALPPGSRLMETGGYKGRSRTLERAELYAAIGARFGLPLAAIRAEYGMTELTSQYYDVVADAPAGTVGVDARRKQAPPWLRTRVVGPDGATLPNGTVGALVHVDLANRGSCIAIATEDLGVQFEDGLVLFGRETAAPPRGCSLASETLRAR